LGVSKNQYPNQYFSITVIESDIDYFNIFKPININKKY